MDKTLEWDGTDWRKVRDAKFTEWLGKEGATCVVLLSTVSETWDDLIDKTVPVSMQDISNAFIISLVDLEVDPFWQKYRSFLFPLMVAGINAWMDSNAMVERGTDTDRVLAFSLRNYGAEIVQMAAFCVGGFGHMRKVSMEIRDFLNHETYSEWEHKHA